MKKSGILTLLLSVIMVAGCSEDDTVPPTLTIETLDYTIADTGGSVEALFDVNVDWTASVKYTDSDAKWLTLSSGSGKAGKVTLTMTAEENASIEERKASVRILYGGEMPCVLSVVQSGKTPTLTIETLNYTIADTGGSVEVSFDVNVDWTASVEYIDSDAKWLTLSSGSGKAGEVTLTMTAEENASIEERKASVRILYGGETPHVLSVVQSGITDITADFDPLFAQELQKRGYVADAKHITFAEVKDITNLNVEGYDSNLQKYTGELTSLQGIEYFESLTSLYCEGNQLTSLDVSKNTALTRLNCSRNQLTTLDVSKNTALTRLDCEVNQLTSLDVSKNTALTRLWCPSNQLTTLDVSKNTALTVLHCGYRNQLTSLDVSKNTALTRLYCQRNQLTSLDVSNNTALTDLYCDENQLTSLDVSKNTALTELGCSSNQLTTLDISNNTALTRLSCYNNQLTSLDVSKNTALTVLNCFENQLTSLDVSKNTVMTELSCLLNQLTSLDVSKNTALSRLWCSSNQLTSLDVSKNTALTELRCYSNQLTTLDVSQNTALTLLLCDYNQLTALDVSKNTALTELNCAYNPGDGTVFPVTAWFDNNSIPNADKFTTGNWWVSNGKFVRIDYRKAD